jgi:hypothetical protein
MNYKTKAHPEVLRRRLELRRSSSTMPHKNKKKYSRKLKYKKLSDV